MRAVAAVVAAAFLACSAPSNRARIIDMPATPDVAAVVRERAAAGRRVLVVVGAAWCEPCHRLHDAVEKGQLDNVLHDTDLLQFDLDRDRAALDAAGYASDMIPLVVVPDAAGRGTPQRFAGSIKGPGAVAEMTPRLRALLARPVP